MRSISYYDLTHHVVPGPQSWTYFGTLTLLPIALLIPRKTLPRWLSILIFLPAMTACTIHAWFKIGGVDVISVDTLLWALFLLALRDPWQDFRRVVASSPFDGSTAAAVGTGLPDLNEEGELLDERTALRIEEDDELIVDDVPKEDPTYQEITYPTSLMARLSWVGALLVSIRLDNWKIGLRSHDIAQPSPPGFSSRLAFARHALFCFIRGYLTLDLTRAYIEYDAYFTDANISITAPLPFEQLRFLSPQLLRTMIIGAQAWALIGQMFYLPCLFPVGLHALGLLPDEWSPHIWPSYFGSPRAIVMNGVRGFWGQYWHQTMRWTVAGPGYAIADTLKLKSVSLWRYGLITVSAFGLSGIVHMGLVPPEPTHATIHVNRVRLCVAGFFWWQPIAVLIEVGVASVMTRLDVNKYWQTASGLKMRMALNTAWVVAWFCFCLPLIGDMGRQLGYWRVWPMPVSLWKWLMGEDWVTWPFLRS